MTRSGAKELFAQVRDLILAARRAAAQSVNVLQVFTSFEIGRRVVELEQGGKARAEYATRTIRELATALTTEFGRGFSAANLANMRRFFLDYSDRCLQRTQTQPAQLPRGALQPQHSGVMLPAEVNAPSLSTAAIFQTASGKGHNPFPLSWSHYVFLLTVRDRDERRFYEIEAAENHWSLPELKRQFGSGLYARLALNRNKAKVRELAQKGQRLESPADVLKNPYVLEFLGLGERSDYSESELETAIIDRLEQFLLELGKGFLFEARQNRPVFSDGIRRLGPRTRFPRRTKKKALPGSLWVGFELGM